MIKDLDSVITCRKTNVEDRIIAKIKIYAASH